MENINFRGIPTSLFLNGPKLGIVTDPQSVSSSSGVVTFSGIATATFPDSNFDFDGGSIAFNWYFDGSRILDTSEDITSNAEIVGFSSATGTGSTITISGLSIEDDQKEVYFEADYIPSAYQSSSPVTAGTARSTGNAFNEPLQSGIGTITITPIIEIITQPKNQSVVTNEGAVYTIAAQKTPGGGAVNYQWQLNGNDLSDGTTTRTVIGGSNAVITITDASGRPHVDNIDFSKVTSYSNFNPGETYTLVSDADVTTKLLLFGAGGGGSDVRSIAGSKGGVSEGTFTFVKDQEYKLIIGTQGDIVTAGRPGGGTGGGTRGSTGRGGGGGYTGLFLGRITHANAIIMAGGGGGSTGDPGRGGAGGDEVGGAGSNGSRAGLGGSQTAGGEGKGSSGSGSALQGGNGSSAGAGGGGYYGGGGGNPSGTISDGAGGGGSGYIHPTLITDGRTFKRDDEFIGSSDNLVYPGGTSQPGEFRIEFTASTKEVSTTVTGSNSETLTITSGGEANGTIRCKLTADNVQESPVFSNTVSYVCVGAQKLLNIETYTYSNATAKLSEFNFEGFRDSTAVCISVVDETANQYDTQSEVDADWNAFRAKYPKRPFWILRPGSENVTLPTAWSSDPNANGPIQVKRDGGNTSSRSDWFTITKLDQAPRGTNVSLVVDKSGSMTKRTVEKSLELFLKKCKEAGIIVNDGTNTEITMSPIEEYIAQHNRELDEDLNKLLIIDYDKYPGNAVCLYARDQDLNVQIELYGGKGEDKDGNSGGEGGYSKIRLTMKRNEEYVVTGLFSAVNAPFLYRKASVIAIVGGGGFAGVNGNGGDGGGIGVSGENGKGVGGGEAPIAIGAGQGGQRARFGSKFDGAALTGGLVPPDHQADGQGNGDSAPCPRGVYWRNQGKAPCDDVGTVKFRTPDGTEISNTATIARGYKSGYNAIQTAGAGELSTESGDGGNGYSGGFGGTRGAGGGGAYGYTDGSVTVVETTQGGSSGPAKIVIRLV